MGKSAKPEGGGKPPEGQATPEAVAKNARWALVGGVLSLAAAAMGAVLFVGLPVAIAVGIVSMSLGQKARALGRQLGAIPTSATAGVVLGAAGAVLAPLLALTPVLF